MINIIFISAELMHELLISSVTLTYLSTKVVKHNDVCVSILKVILFFDKK